MKETFYEGDCDGDNETIFFAYEEYKLNSEEASTAASVLV